MSSLGGRTAALLAVVCVLLAAGVTPTAAQTFDFGNTTLEPDNSTLNVTVEPESEASWIIFDRLQLVLTVTGTVANSATFLVLTVNGGHFSPLILFLLKHQSFVDGWACVMGTALLLQPPMWETGVTVLDFLICHLWHSQTWYWAVVTLSIWNLMLIAVERFIAICYPFKHTYMTKKHLWYALLGMYVISVIFLIPSYMQVHYTEGECQNKFALGGDAGKKLFYAYSIIVVLLIYLLPVAWFVVLYGKVLYTFRMRMNSSTLAASKVIDTANERLTRTAICVTTIFIFTLGYDLLYYMLGYTGVTVYKVNEPIQKIGLLLAVLNSVANPFVYLALMPAYRKSMIMTFTCGKEQPKQPPRKIATTVSTISNSDAANSSPAVKSPPV